MDPMRLGEVLVLQPLAAGRVYTFQVRTVVHQVRSRAETAKQSPQAFFDVLERYVEGNMAPFDAFWIV